MEKFIRNTNRIEKALAEAQKIPVGGLSNYPAPGEVLKSRLMGLESFSQDRYQEKTIRFPKNEGGNNLWNKFLLEGSNRSKSQQKIEKKYKRIFDDFRGSIRG